MDPCDGVRPRPSVRPVLWNASYFYWPAHARHRRRGRPRADPHSCETTQGRYVYGRAEATHQSEEGPFGYARVAAGGVTVARSYLRGG